MSRSKLVIAACLVATNASAQKYTRQPNVTIEVRTSDRTRPVQARAKATVEPITWETALTPEILATTYHAEQATMLQRLIASTPDSAVDEKSDYWFRLAELHARQQRLSRLQSAEAAIRADHAKTPADKTNAQAAATAAGERATSAMVEAVKAYRALTENDAFRNWAKMDLALFAYGYTLRNAKYMKEARAVFDKLLKNYPGSKYVADAQLVFADYYFEQAQLADAESRYKLVLKFPRSSAYWYAMYKLGWIDLNLARFQEALDLFFQVAQGTKNDAKQNVLHRAAEKDFVRAYAEVGKADKALDAFRRVDPKSAFAMLGLLADIYLEQGKSDKGIYTYRELMKLAPKDKNVCNWQYNVAHLMLSLPGASTADKLAEVDSLARMWKALAVGRRLPGPEAQDCRDNAAAMSGELARVYHSEAARTQNADTLAYAEKLYKIYLDTFPTAPDHAVTAYYYAELLWSRALAEPNRRLAVERWESAANAFTAALQTGKLDPRLTHESARASVLAWMKALEVDARPSAKAPADDDKAYTEQPVAQPIPLREQKQLAAFDAYLAYVKDPNDDERIGMTFLEGNIYRRYSHFERAIPLFQNIVDHHPTHETAEYAANLLLDIYNRQQDEASLITLADRLLANATLLADRPDLAARVKQLKRMRQRREAEQLAKTKDFAALVRCGEAYLDIYNRTPDAPDNDEVLYDAGVCFEQARSLSAAIRMYRLLQRFFPKSKLAARALMRLGKVYGDVASYGDAAEQLEQYAKKYAGEQDAYDAMNDAVVYRKGIGEDAKAIDDTKYFVKTFGATKPVAAANAAFSLTSIYEKQGDADAVIRHLREYIRVYGARGGHDKLLIAYAKIGRILFEQSCSVKGVDGACIKISRARAVVTRPMTRQPTELPKQCGGESKIKITVVQRESRKLAEAMQAFATAARELPKLSADAGEARHYYALVKLAEADVELEKYLALAFPANLDFDPAHDAIKRKSLARFDAWYQQKTKLGATARAKYDLVLGVKDAAASIAAAARVGQIPQHFADALFTAEVPSDLRSGPYAQDKVEAYCDQMTVVAEPLEAKALAAYGVCLNKSTELGWFSEWSKLCERELGQIKPEQYPTASELRGESRFVAQVIATEPPPRLD